MFTPWLICRFWPTVFSRPFLIIADLVSCRGKCGDCSSMDLPRGGAAHLYLIPEQIHRGSPTGSKDVGIPEFMQ